MKSSTRLSATLAVAAALAACGPTKLVGDDCSSDGDCVSSMCLRSKCTTPCQSQSDCVLGFDCGVAAVGDPSATCYARTYDQTPPAKGGFGADCSVVSTDPRSPAAPCDPKAQNPCAPGFACVSSRKCDPNAYCSAACKTDPDCPPTFYCATLGDKSQKCLKRSHCIPCGADDQCSKDSVCATDVRGERFCAKRCSADTDCPQPPADKLGSAFQICRPDPTPRATPLQVCIDAPNGLCHGPSVVAGVSGDDNICSPCRIGFPDDCMSPLQCFQDEFTTELFCTTGCTVSVRFYGGDYRPILATDTCQAISTNLFCLHAPPPLSCGNSCKLQGICTADAAYNDSTCHEM
jgi:hypothetical protein